MEIHAPHGTIHSLKDFLIHLLTITVGVLIALSLDGIVEWRHHRHLVHEAESNLTREIQENRASLEVGLKGMDETQIQLQNILKNVQAMMANRAVESDNMNLSISITTLQEAAWNTASSTAALSLMDYDEVQHYAVIYDLQQNFSVLQQRALDALQELESYSPFLHVDVKQIPVTVAFEAQRTVGRALAAVHMADNMGKALEAKYRQQTSE